MESLKIVLLCVLAAVTYGVLQDQITAHVCREYFTIGHPSIGTEDSTLLAFGWGFLATWWVGLGLGLLLAFSARFGSRPRLTVRDLVRPVVITILCVGVAATIAGLIGYLAAQSGRIVLIGPLPSGCRPINMCFSSRTGRPMSWPTRRVPWRAPWSACLFGGSADTDELIMPNPAAAIGVVVEEQRKGAAMTSQPAADLSDAQTAVPRDPLCFAARRGDFLVSTDQTLLDLPLIHQFLSNDSYWAAGRPLSVVRRSLANSLCFGLYASRQQIGLARVVTDRATFAWLCDVFVLESHRGKSLSKWLLQCVLSHPDLQGLRRFLLATRDAHGLYERYGFAPLEEPSRFMQVYRDGSNR
jgi:GNAT superfamily N-acetyltransferase